ncbi:hypothetical protein [Halomonas sp. M20]|uniref:hypothetical protein n=1 Tax=Halomonas sp. M20 TaxID=2763264 RepID=UPI001D0B73F2|nr:hypothetical protein [Halomonas sp. M20]
MAKIRLKELGILGIALGLTMEAPAFAEDAQSDADASDQHSTTTMQDSSAREAARQGDIRKQDEPKEDTEGGMVKEDNAGFGSGGEAMPGTDLPEPPEQEKDKEE